MVSQGTYVNIENMNVETIPLLEDEYGFRIK